MAELTREQIEKYRLYSDLNRMGEAICDMALRSLDQGQEQIKECIKVCEREQERTCDKTPASYSAQWADGRANGCADCAEELRKLLLAPSHGGHARGQRGDD